MIDKLPPSGIFGERSHPQSVTPTLTEQLQSVINRNAIEGGSDTPDFILARFIILTLRAFDEVVNARERWYGRPGVAAPLASNAFHDGNPMRCSSPDGGPPASAASREAVARAWCTPENQHKVMDPMLAEACARILDEEIGIAVCSQLPGEVCSTDDCCQAAPIPRVLKKPSRDPNMVFHDLTDEKYREYVYHDEHGPFVVWIDDPQALHISKSGTHRVLAKNGVCHIINPGWQAIRFETKTDYGFRF